MKSLYRLKSTGTGDVCIFLKYSDSIIQAFRKSAICTLTNSLSTIQTLSGLASSLLTIVFTMYLKNVSRSRTRKSDYVA